MHARFWLPWQVVAILLLIGAAADAVRGQAPPPPKPNPQAPVLTPAVPMGVQRGASLELMLTGKNLAEPTGLLTTFPAKSTFPTPGKTGQPPAKLPVRIDVPADAPLGFHALSLATSQGMSNPLIFCIDELSQVLQIEASRNKATAQALTVPCVVAGNTANLNSDFYKIAVAAGQRLSFEILGRRLGSPLDPELALYSVKTGRLLAHANDSPGLQTDARLTYTFTEAGDYLLQVKDVLNRGGADYCYRLRVGDFPCATVPIPMAARRGSKVTVQFAGPEVTSVTPVTVTVPTDPTVNVLWLTPRRASGPAGWPVALLVSDLEERVEQEPNDTPAQANRLAVPGAVTGRFEKDHDTDFYSFPAKKGTKYLLQAQTVELYSPTLVYFTVKDSKGNELARSNPDAVPPADQRIEWTAPADGDFLVEVQHLNYQGGPSEAYRLTITPAQPSFDLTLGLDRWDVAAGGAQLLPIQVARNNFAGPIEIQVIAPHPGLTGQLTLDGNAKTGALLLQAREDVPPGPYRLRLQGKATVNGQSLAEWVKVRGAISEALADLPFPPPDLDDAVAVAVKPKAPFRLAVAFDHPEAVPGLQTGVTVTIQRTAGFDEPVSLLPPEGLPGKVNLPALKPITKGQDSLKFALPLDPKVPLGKHVALFRAKAKVKNQDVIASSPATLVVTSPFTLQVDPVAVKLQAGAKDKVKITAARKGGYAGPINLELRNLPAGVQAAKATIAQGQTAVDMEIAAAPTAAIGERKDVNVLGTAPAANNQQSASPNFTISVSKKQ